MKHLLRRILGVLTPERRRQLAFLQILLCFVSVMELVGVFSIAPFMAVASQPSMISTNHWLALAYERGGFRTPNAFLVFLGAASLGLLIFSNVVNLFAKWCLTRFGLRLGSELGIRLFRRYLEKSYLFHVTSNSAELTKNVVQEVARITNNVIVEVLNVNSKIFSVVFIAGGLLFVNVAMTLAAALLLGASYLLVYLTIKRKLKTNGQSISRVWSKKYQLIAESFGGIKEIKISGKEELYVSAFLEHLDEYMDLIGFNLIVPVLPRYFIEMVTTGGAILAVLYFIENGRSLHEMLPVFTLFVMASLRILPALQQLFGSLATIRSSAYALNLVYDDLRVPSDGPPQPVTAKPFATKLAQAIRFSAVDFKYPNATAAVFRNLNFEIGANTSVALVGPSGSGKSTLVDLLLGLVQPEAGQILVDGQDIHRANQTAAWQRSIGYVPQSVFLLDNTIAANIAFTIDPAEIDLERVRVAARMALLDEMIEAKPQKYQTLVGERGIQLSGGQRQRVAIARALYHDPAILLFDEPTGALDSLTEAEVIESINSLAHQKTIVLVTHKLSTARRCDRIFLLKSGAIVDAGSFDELYGRNELFRQMANA